MAGLVRDVVGNTPIIKLKTLSDLTGCEIWGKAEFLNPGGSVKDRAAVGILKEAESRGHLTPTSVIYEGTAGNTGIGLATVAAQAGYKIKLVMPDNQSQEKNQILTALGAEVLYVKPVPFSDQNHFYHQARRLAEADPSGFWANQFENTANGKAHFQTTGPEIWNQLQGHVTDFCCAVGSGGTMSGVSRFLKSQDSSIRVTLADPFGSGLYTYFKTGQLASTGTSVTEGIGIMRLTANFLEAQIDHAIQITDQEMIEMLYYLAKYEGILVGTSAALNVVAATRLALANPRTENGQKRVIVTILCDSALRYQSKVFNPVWLKANGLIPAHPEYLKN
jgi:cysteine synthase A